MSEVLLELPLPEPFTLLSVLDSREASELDVVPEIVTKLLRALFRPCL